MERWIIQPNDAPLVIRNCNKCGIQSKFRCSGKFRLNANGKNIDVWLIYKCIKCETTWNMEILSRVKPEKIDKNQYQAFLKNNWYTALNYAFDFNILNKNKAVVSCDEVTYTVEKQEVAEANYVLEIVSQNDFGLRLDKLLSEELGLSRTRVKVLLETGYITSDEIALSAKTKIKGTIRIKELNLYEK